MSNTAYLGGQTVLSQLSLNDPSGATLTASDGSFGGNLTVQGTSTLVGAVTQSAPVYVPSGSAILPEFAFSSEASLGFYRSGTSAIAQSYGTLTVSGLAFTKLAGSAFTAASSATTRTFADASFEFSVLSLTSNGAQIAFRSGQTIWKFASVAAG